MEVLMKVWVEPVSTRATKSAPATYAELQGVGRGDPSQCMEGDTDSARVVRKLLAIF